MKTKMVSNGERKNDNAGEVRYSKLLQGRTKKGKVKQEGVKERGGESKMGERVGVKRGRDRRNRSGEGEEQRTIRKEKTEEK